MTFSADPHSLDGYAALLGRAHADAQQCKAYFTENVPDLSPGVDGLLNFLTYEHAGVQNQLGAMLDQLVTLLDSSREEVTQAAAGYRKTDAGAAAQIDKTYPEVLRPQWRRD